MVVVYSLLSLLPLLLFLSLLIIDTANSRGESDTTLVTRTLDRRLLVFISIMTGRSRSLERGVTAPSGATPTLAPVTIKIPPFWPSDPELWFGQVEAQFTTKGVSSQRTRFDYVVASLSPEYAAEVRDLILNPPTTAPYDHLKEQLIRRTTASEQRRLQQLFTTRELGDCKPSQLLRRIQQLLGDKLASTDRAFLRELFLQRLPQNVRMVLAATKDTEDLETLATLADKVMEVAPPTVSTATTESSQLSTEVDQLRAEIAGLKELVQSASSQPAKSTRQSRRSPSPQPRRQRGGWCWYHMRFAERAMRCQPPCSWKSENEPAGR